MKRCRFKPLYVFSLLIFIYCGLPGCVTRANSVLTKTIKRGHLSTFILSTAGYELPVYTDVSLVENLNANASLDKPAIQQLHIYLEGDGRPWVYGHKIATNPTSRNPLALKLMLKDKHPSVYLNRPCYGLDKMPKGCTNDKWTDGRYSEYVVNVLDNALDVIKKRLNVQRFVLIGHSGGGSLAILLSSIRDDVNKLVTVAANVDHVRWTQSLSYLPLDKSLNPVDVLSSIDSIEQWHFIGVKDQVLPVDILLSAFGFLGAKSNFMGIQKHSKNKMTVVTYPDYGHHCCWENEWPMLLKSIQ